jgi:hypothetical protein
MHFLISTVEDIYKNCNMYRYKKAVCEIHTAFSLMMKIYKVSDKRLKNLKSFVGRVTKIVNVIDIDKSF